MNSTDQFVHKMLNVDVIQQVEDFTGENYKTSDKTQMLCLATSIEFNKYKDKVLKTLDDTTFSNKVDNYLRIAKEEGFKIIYSKKFEGHSFYGEKPSHETLYIMYNDELGILLKFDTYNQNRVNGGSFYYNIIPYEDMINKGHNILQSGEFTRLPSDHIFKKHYVGKETYSFSIKRSDKWGFLIQQEYFYYHNYFVWSGDHDCREGLRNKIKTLKSYGEFQVKWIKQPFLWLLHYMDTEEYNYDYKKITEDRILEFPEYIINNIVC